VFSVEAPTPAGIAQALQRRELFERLANRSRSAASVKDRLVTLACALGALALLSCCSSSRSAVLVAEGCSPPDHRETRGNGYHAAYAWLAASHLRTVSQRERFDALLARGELAPTGNVLVVTLPGTEVLKITETRRLQKWIRTGNTLLVLAPGGRSGLGHRDGRSQRRGFESALRT